MGIIRQIFDHGIECIKKSAFVSDDTRPQEYSLRTYSVGGEINSTITGTPNVKIKELENDISVNSNKQLKVTQYDSSGTEGQNIIGVKWKSGNSGIDKATNTLQTIEYEHHEIHAGSHFYICGFEVLNLNGQANFGFQTANTTEWAHMTFEISGSTETEFYIYEGATYTGGTARAAMNNDRNSTNVDPHTIVYNPTVSAVGNLIFSQSKGKEVANPQAADSEGIVGRDREIILKQNTAYLFRIVSKGAGNNVSYCGEWYSHQNKN
jgi:hypothetical protein